MNKFKLRLLAAALLSASVALSAAPVKAKARPKAKPAAVAAPAAAPVALAASVSSSVKVLGDSTLHKWEAKATKLEISALLAAGQSSAWDGATKGQLKDLKLTIQVDGLKSNESEKMDKNMKNAMEADKFATITFVMASYEAKDGDVVAKGSLTIHGVSKDVELKGKLSQKDKAVNVKGSFDLLMSEYGIKPPVMMLGTVRVADKVSIAYDFDLDSAK